MFLSNAGSSTAWLLPSSYPDFVRGVEGSNPRDISLEELQIYGEANVALTEEGSATDAITLNLHTIQVGERERICVCVGVCVCVCVCARVRVRMCMCVLSLIHISEPTRPP